MALWMDRYEAVTGSSLCGPEQQQPLHSGQWGEKAERLLRVESVSSTLRAVDIRPLVGGANGGLPRWMTAALSIPVIDVAVLLGEPMTASRQAP